MDNKKSRKNNDDKCFQYVLTAVLNHKQIKSHPERIPKINLLLIGLIRKKYILQHIKKTGKSLN